MLHLWKNIPKKFANAKNYWEVRDHSHYAGKYRAAAHGICDLKLNVQNEIPIVFHDS